MFGLRINDKQSEEIVKGQSATLLIRIVDECSGLPMNVNGATALLKLGADNVAGFVSVAGVVSGNVQLGTFKFELSPAQTEKLTEGLQIEVTNGSALTILCSDTLLIAKRKKF